MTAFLIIAGALAFAAVAFVAFQVHPAGSVGVDGTRDVNCIVRLPDHAPAPAAFVMVAVAVTTPPTDCVDGDTETVRLSFGAAGAARRATTGIARRRPECRCFGWRFRNPAAYPSAPQRFDMD